MKNEKTIVLCSGGLNSAVLASMAQAEHEPALLHVRFEHRTAERETALFERMAERLGIRETLVLDMPHLALVGGNARVNRRKQVEDALALGEGPTNCYIPGLIGALCSAAFSWAMAKGAAKVLIGVSENLGPPAPQTSYLFPDYGRDFIQLCGHQFALASPDRPVALSAPLIDLERGDIIRLGMRLGTPFELTWSCLAGTEEPCGRCLGCATRNRGFLDAAVPDPIMRKAAAL